jgi:hypothetical protein
VEAWEAKHEHVCAGLGLLSGPLSGAGSRLGGSCVRCGWAGCSYVLRVSCGPLQVMLFIFSKIPELIDTVFIVFRKSVSRVCLPALQYSPLARSNNLERRVPLMSWGCLPVPALPLTLLAGLVCACVCVAAPGIPALVPPHHRAALLLALVRLHLLHWIVSSQHPLTPPGRPCPLARIVLFAYSAVGWKLRVGLVLGPQPCLNPSCAVLCCGVSAGTSWR